MFYKYGIPIVHLRNIMEYEIGIQTVQKKSTLKKYKQLVVQQQEQLGIQTVPIRSTLKKYKQLVVDTVRNTNCTHQVYYRKNIVGSRNSQEYKQLVVKEVSSRNRQYTEQFAVEIFRNVNNSGYERNTGVYGGTAVCC